LFITEFQATKQKLCSLTRARSVEIFLGSGTLADDVVGAQLSVEKKPGLVLSNGEFGDRLIDQARRFKLDFEPVRFEWGEPFDLSIVRKHLQSFFRAPQWIWCVHCETSTGVLNDLAALKNLAAEYEIKLCLDCISSIGTVPVDLSGVFLASGVSGKGLGAFPGLSMVFYHHEVPPAPKQLPRYLDLGFYAAQQGIPFTHSSNLLSALQAALKRLNVNESYKTLVELSAQLRVRLADLGYQIVAPSSHASPAVFTLALPAEINSKTVGWQLQKAGYLLSYRSDYLISRNWIQICLMGEFSRQHLDSLLAILAKFRPRRSRLPAGASLEPVGI